MCDLNEMMEILAQKENNNEPAEDITGYAFMISEIALVQLNQATEVLRQLNRKQYVHY